MNNHQTKSDTLSAEGIRRHFSGSLPSLKIEILPTATSTNALVREKARSGEQEGYLLIAEGQTGGRGRLGRSFFSPAGSGIYMSLLLRPPHASPTAALSITTTAAVALCRAIEEISPLDPKIKWVNDIYLNGKKVSGILTEGGFSADNKLEFAVLGIGINVYSPEGGFPPDIENIAGALFTEKIPEMKNRLIAGFVSAFFAEYPIPSPACIEEYRKRNLALHKTVTLIRGEEKTSAKVLDIDESCRLLVEYPDGTRDICGSGEISLKLE